MQSKGISRAFLDRIQEEMPTGSDVTPEEQLDYLLPLYRSIQSEVANGEAKLAFLNPIIVSALSERERNTGKDEYIADTRRTMGKLIRSLKPLSGQDVKIKVGRIRQLAGRVLGRTKAGMAVAEKKTVAYSVNWDLIAEGGPKLTQEVRDFIGLKPKPALSVGGVSKRAKLGKKKRR